MLNGEPVAEMNLALLFDYLVLVYGEARNVRFLLARSDPKYRFLMSLPRNRELAWTEIDRRLSADCRSKSSAMELENLFTKAFGVSLAELADLFRDDEWRHSGLRGGNRWAAISEAIGSFSTAIDAEDTGIEAVLQQIGEMRHNTGLLSTKLSQLRDSRKHRIKT